MACDTLEEFRTLATYRKSFNPDLQIAKSRPMKFIVLEGFKFERDQKNLLLVLGTVASGLLDELKGHASKVKAEGMCSFVDNVVQVTLKSGQLSDSELKKGLEWATVKREGKVSDAKPGRSDDDDEERPLPPRVASASAGFLKARADLEEFMKARVAALQWHENEIKTQQDAEKKITEIESVIAAIELKIAAAQTRATELTAEVKELRRDEKTAKYSKGAIVKLEKAVTDQGVLVDALSKKIETQRKTLPALGLLAQKHGSSRHGAQTDMGLQARRAATGGVSPDQSDNVHGVSEKRVDDPDGAKTPVAELKWRKTSIRYVKEGNGKRKVVNATEVLKAILTDIKEMDSVATSTASKFLSHELEKEAVDRAIAMVQKNCVWTEIEDGDKWLPLNSVTVYVGPPRTSAGWGFAVQRKADAPKVALEEANAAIEKFRAGTIDEAEMLKQLDVTLVAVEEEVGGKKSSSVPLVKSARVTLGRTSSGWTSITHFPDPTATPSGWTLKGRFVRANPKATKTTAPGGSLP